MAYENGVWIMHGTSPTDRNRIKSPEELVEFVDKVGFLPLFKNEAEGFSVEEHTLGKYWWSGDEKNDPWEWRGIAARSKKVAYGKFFGKKSGFVSLEWFPAFANYRRDGYDFDSLYEEGLAQRRAKLIMEQFADGEELFSFEIKNRAGFGKGGEKNFQGVLTELQMQTYLVMSDLRFRKNKKGEEYGMSVSMYTAPELLWGQEFVTSGYSEEPEKSLERIIAHVKKHFPDGGKALEKLLR